MWQPITHEIQNTLCERVVNDLSVIVDRTILYFNIGSIEVGLNLLTDVHQIDESSPILLANCIQCLLVFRVVGVDCVRHPVDGSGNLAATCDDDCLCGCIVHTSTFGFCFTGCSFRVPL